MTCPINPCKRRGPVNPCKGKGLINRCKGKGVTNLCKRTVGAGVSVAPFFEYIAGWLLNVG